MSSLSKVGWYWHRLRAMSPREISLHIAKKFYQLQDKRRLPDFSQLSLEATGRFPQLPPKEYAPTELLKSLRRDADDILAGRWRAFGHLPLQVDDPPKWQFDYLAKKDFQTDCSAFELDHRAQPGGADIKVIWEPSRWNQLVRLAMAAWLLDDERAQARCIEWLHDWRRTNKPFTGLNWTSGLETGLRLVQFTWIDAFLSAAGTPAKELAELRAQILPPHVWFTWRYRSFGSSANNHLLGELAGVALALARWPGLSAISTPLPGIARLFEREVLAQFAEDGGNKEQALGYHLFSFEFCWQALRALQAADFKVWSKVEERLIKAGKFYRDIKPKGDFWDFGDSDNAFVTPLFCNETRAAEEWWSWFENSKQSTALEYWWGRFPKRRSTDGLARSAPDMAGEWRIFPKSGYAVFQTTDWFLRFDCSPLGYLSMAPHGHLDALHLSVWYRGQAIIVDPGTGAYYADPRIRSYLASCSAHNGPHFKDGRYPSRRGTFLWENHHAVPRLNLISRTVVESELQWPSGKASRRISFFPDENSIAIEDSLLPRLLPRKSPATIVTHWKFAPGLNLQEVAQRTISITGSHLNVQFRPRWMTMKLWTPPADISGRAGHTLEELSIVPMESIVAPAFRTVVAAPYVTLEAPSDSPSLQVVLAPA